MNNSISTIFLLTANYLSKNLSIQSYLTFLSSLNPARAIERKLANDGSSRIIGYGIVITELHVLQSLVHAFKTKNDPLYKKAKNSYYQYSVPQSVKVLKEYPQLNNLEVLESLLTSVYETLQIKKAEASCTLDKKEKQFSVLDINKTHTLLKEKHGSIIYSDGLYQLTTTEGWGGVIRGIVLEDTINTLLANKVIERTPYFNSKGRKCFELTKANRKPLPSWMKNLDPSYLRACGVGVNK